jgi:pimeloyl-ACP methyl ester carboxylesterase
MQFFETSRHRTAYLEAGPADGPLMIFLHGWPELGILWRAQLARFAADGWRCVAPDMRGYGGSSVPTDTGAYALREIARDMIELHDALGGAPAVWVAHDWGSPVAWSLAAHHAERCRGIASLCVPYHARGFALPSLLPLVDRTIYPADLYPAGQWDYFLDYREHFDRAANDFEADVSATMSLVYRRGSPAAIGRPAKTASVRANGGWYGSARRAPAKPRDETMLSQFDFDALVAAFAATGFRGADAWYVNDSANIAYATEAPNDGRIALPVLLIHAAWDSVCDSAHGRLAEPMRSDCSDMVETTIDAGHFVMQERPAEVDAALARWLAVKGLGV